jgi:hypothetical protein
MTPSHTVWTPELIEIEKAAPAQPRTTCKDLLSLAADVLELRAWRDMDPLACILLAAFTAILVQPIVFGQLGSSIFALMTPVK